MRSYYAKIVGSYSTVKKIDDDACIVEFYIPVVCDLHGFSILNARGEEIYKSSFQSVLYCMNGDVVRVPVNKIMEDVRLYKDYRHYFHKEQVSLLLKNSGWIRSSVLSL